MILEAIDFIKELYHQNHKIDLHAPIFLGQEKEYLCRAIDSTFVSYVGENVVELEKRISQYTGRKYATATVNGTSALHLGLMCCGVKEGQEVITQPLSFVAACNAISFCGAKPTFVDVDSETWGMSPASLKEFIESHTVRKGSDLVNKHTNRVIAAVLPVHVFGHVLDIEGVAAICQEHRLPLVEDAAEAVGSFRKRKHAGTTGKVGILSFNGNKIITTGGGGMIISDCEETIRKARHLATTGKVAHPWNFEHDEIAYNYRMPNINAALGLAQFEQLPRFLKIKRILAKKYHQFFENSPQVEFKVESSDCTSNYWLNAILLPGEKEKEEFLTVSNAAGVMCRPAWKLLPELPFYRKCYVHDDKHSKELSKRLVNIPSGISPHWLKDEGGWNLD